MEAFAEFVEQRSHEIAHQGRDTAFRAQSEAWLQLSVANKYSYHFSSLGRPIIQYPQDIVQIQELIWEIRPDLVIETGIAHGGSLILSAAMLALLDYTDAVASESTISPRSSNRRVLGVDIDIRAHNRQAIEAHPMSHMIEMIEGSSTDPSVISRVHDIASKYCRTMVILDSNHTHAHVLAELEAYAPLTSRGSYCIVFDTVVEDLPEAVFLDRPWGVGNNPKTAVWEYLRLLTDETRHAVDGDLLRLKIDSAIQDKLLVTVAPDGYLKRI